MPFDAMLQTKVQTLDPLDELGIMTIPESVISAHKKAMLARYGNRPMDRWIEISMSLDTLPYAVSWWSAPPRAVRDIAHYVQQNVPSCRFTIGVFQMDPYLMVNYRDHDGCARHAYLGLWMSRWNLKAIARHPSSPTLRRSQWLSRIGR